MPNIDDLNSKINTFTNTQNRPGSVAVQTKNQEFAEHNKKRNPRRCPQKDFCYIPGRYLMTKILNDH